jgi:hypothetical protein
MQCIQAPFVAMMPRFAAHPQRAAFRLDAGAAKAIPSPDVQLLNAWVNDGRHAQPARGA